MAEAQPPQTEVKAKIEDIDAQTIDFSVLADYGMQKHLYHGTNKDNACSVLKKGKMYTGNDLSYLGKGVYCYHLDIHASIDWAKSKYGYKEIAILHVVADLGNMFLICEELRRAFNKQAKEYCGRDTSRIQKCVGLLIEWTIKYHIEPRYEMEIHTVGRAYVINQRKKRVEQRPALMYCLRYPDTMIKDMELYWEAS